MDIFEFTQALRRQRRLLAIGGIMLLLAVVLLTFDVSPNGIEPRIGPRYTTSVRMVVAPADTDTLGAAQATDGVMSQTALFFQTLLLSPDTILEIERDTGVDIQEMTVVADGNVITVSSIAATPDGAVATALGSFDWLTRRLEEPFELFAAAPAGAGPSLLDEDGRLATTVTVDVSPAFATDGTGLWLDLVSDGSEIATLSLADTAIEEGASAGATIEPGGELTLRLEDVAGEELDSVTLGIPALPAEEDVPYTLSVQLDRGAVVGLPIAGVEPATEPDVSDARLQGERLAVSWVEPDAATGQTQPTVGLILLTEEPIPMETGARRGPIITFGALLGGTFALITAAIAIDSWRQAYRRRASSLARDRLAEIRPLNSDRTHTAAGPLSRRVTARSAHLTDHPAPTASDAHTRS